MNKWNVNRERKYYSLPFISMFPDFATYVSIHRHSLIWTFETIWSVMMESNISLMCYEIARWSLFTRHLPHIYLLYSQTLKVLVLEWNLIKTPGAQHLAGVLRDNQVLLIFSSSLLYLSVLLFIGTHRTESLEESNKKCWSPTSS